MKVNSMSDEVTEEVVTAPEETPETPLETTVPEASAEEVTPTAEHVA